MERQLPEQLTAMLREAVGESASATLADALRTEAPSLSVRVNPAKGGSVPPGAAAVPWEPLGFYLAERPLFAADPAWHRGEYYVQDASSMAVGALTRYLAEKYFAPDSNINYLDACAAPGGKTIGAADALGPRAFIVANEADRRRAAVLAENLARYGSPGIAVLCGPAQRLGALSDTFDIIAADAPCSGEGMIRKESEAIAQWSTALVDSCAALQKEIVSELWPALRPGGIFIYSTCTFNRREDEDVVRYMVATLGAEIIDIDAALFPGALKGEYGLRFLPGFVRGEGLFMAALRKPDLGSARTARSPRLVPPLPGMADFARRTIERPEEYTVTGGSIIPRRHADIAARIAGVRGLVRIGLPLGETKGRDIAPSHELVMSTVLRREAYPLVDLPYRAALSYLRGEALDAIPDGTPKGFVTPAWHGRPLGFAKNIGRRANNLYPDPLRLRLQPNQLPDSPPQILI